MAASNSPSSKATLPLLAVAILTIGEIILVVEAAMDGVSREEYINTARAIGMPEKRGEAIRALARSINFPGLSSVLFSSLQARDYPLVVGGLLFIGVISVGARIVLDVLHAMLDPRTRYGQTDRPSEMAL